MPRRAAPTILHQIAAVRGAINGLMAEVLEEHVRTHIADPRSPVTPNEPKEPMS